MESVDGGLDRVGVDDAGVGAGRSPGLDLGVADDSEVGGVGVGDASGVGTGLSPGLRLRRSG